MIKINNIACLPYEIIGKIYDNYIKNDLQITIFDGMKYYELFDYKRKEYKMTIEHKTNQINIAVEESNLLAKKISKKGLRFPKLK